MKGSGPAHTAPNGAVSSGRPVRPQFRVARRASPATAARRPVIQAGATSATVRALTAALAPHLSTADPELHGLAATLLSAQHAYALSASAAVGAGPDEVRRRYAEAAREYCVALDRRGFAPPPGLPEAVGWLSGEGSPAPALAQEPPEMLRQA